MKLKISNLNTLPCENKKRKLSLIFVCFFLALLNFSCGNQKKPQTHKNKKKSFLLIKKKFSSLKLEEEKLIPEDRFVIFATNYGCLTKSHSDRSKLSLENKNFFLRQAGDSVNLRISNLEDFNNLKQSYRSTWKKYQNNLEILGKIGKLIKKNCPS